MIAAVIGTATAQANDGRIQELRSAASSPISTAHAGSRSVPTFRSRKRAARPGDTANRQAAIAASVRADQATTSGVPDVSNGSTYVVRRTATIPRPTRTQATGTIAPATAIAPSRNANVRPSGPTNGQSRAWPAASRSRGYPTARRKPRLIEPSTSAAAPANGCLNLVATHVNATASAAQATGTHVAPNWIGTAIVIEAMPVAVTTRPNGCRSPKRTSSPSPIARYAMATAATNAPRHST